MVENRAPLVVVIAELGGIKVVAPCRCAGDAEPLQSDSFASLLVREDEG